MADTDAPLVLLIDLVLPKLSGLEVLADLQAAPARMPVIVLSAYARLIDRRCVAGAHQKPYGARELLRDIERNLPPGRSALHTTDEVLERLFPHVTPPRRTGL